jgi:hypothetical protein
MELTEFVLTVVAGLIIALRIVLFFRNDQGALSA